MEHLRERFDKLDGSITYNLHQEISQIKQGIQSVASYFSKLKALWDGFESMVPSLACNFPRSKEFLIYLQRHKLYQFLLGLNESFSQARSQILLMSPLPTVNQAH